jgi:UPF0755 protein
MLNYKRIAIAIVLIALAIFTYNAFKVYNNIFAPNVNLDDKETMYLYIPTGATFDTVKNILYDDNYITDSASFEWVAEKMNYKNHVYPGRYLVEKNMSNKELINMLRAGTQAPVKVVFNNLRDKKDFATVISEQLEADAASILQLLNDEEYLAEFGLNKKTALCIFLPNTYEFYWNTLADAFIRRMYDEYVAFWDEQKKAKAEKAGLTIIEVSILASIIDEETRFTDEKPTIAGVYINRLNKGMRLQADPTIRYLLGNKVNRVLKKHLQIASPYNTYRNDGLPPGPIRIPSINAIEAVLNYEHHDYLFFCAKDDFSGYHSFAKTLSEHNKNARLYQQALNKKRIWR